MWIKTLNVLIFCIIFSVFYSNESIAYENIIENGDFSDGLSYWNFVDTSQTYQSCPHAYSEAYITNNRSTIHSYSVTAWGDLRQTIPKILPHIFEFDYEFNGACTGIIARLKYNLSNIFYYALHSDGDIAAVSSRYFNNVHLYSGDVVSWSGRIKVQFDYENSKILIYFNNRKIDEYNLILNAIDSVELQGGNGCCDGRNNGYAYFDNITLIPYAYSLDSVPSPTNHSVIITDSDWRNVISASATKAPVLVSETGNVTPEMGRFLQEYGPDYVYTIGLASGLNNSFEIMKEDVPALFFPNASKAVYVNLNGDKEKGVLAAQIANRFGMPVVFDKTGNYSKIADSGNMSVQDLQGLYLDMVTGRRENVDYLVLADLNSSEGELAGYVSGMRDGFVVPVSSANKSFLGIKQTLNETIGLLGSKGLYQRHVSYRKGEPLYLAILGGNGSVPYVRFFDPGLEVFDNRDGWWLYSDLGYADSNWDGFFDLATGRMEGGLGAISLHMARQFLPKNQSAVLIGEYRHPKYEDMKFFGGGMTQALAADILLREANASTKRIVEQRMSGLDVFDNSSVLELLGKFNAFAATTIAKALLQEFGKGWGLIDRCEMAMYAILEFDWVSWGRFGGAVPYPHHLDIINGNLTKKIGSPGIIGYFGVGEKTWTIPKAERSYLEMLFWPYSGGTSFGDLSFSGFLYDDHDMSANSSIKDSVLREGGSVLASSGIVHDPYTIQTSTMFFRGLAQGKPLGEAFIESANIDPLQGTLGFMFLYQIYTQAGQGKDAISYPFLYTKDKLERVLFSDPSLRPVDSKAHAQACDYSVTPCHSFKAESRIESNYTINGTIDVWNADDYLIEKESPITPVFVREFILPENAAVNWVNLSGSYSGRNASAELVYNDSHYSNWTRVAENCTSFLGFGGLQTLSGEQEEQLADCMEDALRPNVSYPYPNSTFWWREARLLDNRSEVMVFIPAVIFENESFARVLENASVQVDYEAGTEMGVYAKNAFLGNNASVRVELMNMGGETAGNLWVFVEGNCALEFSENVTVEAGGNLTREFSFAAPVGDYEATAVFESGSSIGPRYAYFVVETPPSLVVDGIPEAIVNEGETGSFQILMKNNGSVRLENVSLSYGGPFDADFGENGFDMEPGEERVVMATVSVPDMQAPGKFANALSFRPENDKIVVANLSVEVPARAVPEMDTGEQVLEIRPGRYSGTSFNITNSGNVLLEAELECLFDGIACELDSGTIALSSGEAGSFYANLSVPEGFPDGQYIGGIVIYGNGFSQPETVEIPLVVIVPGVSYWSVNPLEWVCMLPDCKKDFSVANSVDSNAPLHADISLEGLDAVSVQSEVDVEPGRERNVTAEAKIPAGGIVSGVYSGNITFQAADSEPLAEKINITVIAKGPEFTIEKDFQPDSIRLFWKQFVVPKINHVELYINNTGNIPIERINISDEVPDGWKGKRPVISFVKRNRKSPVKESSFTYANGYANFSFDFSGKPLKKGEGLEVNYLLYSQPEFVPFGDIDTNVMGEARRGNVYSKNGSVATLKMEYFNPPAWLRWLFILIYGLR